MYEDVIVPPAKIIHEIIQKNQSFPNNPWLPLLLYKKALILREDHARIVEEIFLHNHWINAWKDSIYPFHHYHSNTHEVLGICKGTCKVEIGGENGQVFLLERGDVLILPAGVCHKNLECSKDFLCIGAYPRDIPYDMKYGKSAESLTAEETIKKVPLPKSDPVYGVDGPLFQFWREVSPSGNSKKDQVRNRDDSSDQ